MNNSEFVEEFFTGLDYRGKHNALKYNKDVQRKYWTMVHHSTVICIVDPDPPNKGVIADVFINPNYYSNSTSKIISLIKKWVKQDHSNHADFELKHIPHHEFVEKCLENNTPIEG